MCPSCFGVPQILVPTLADLKNGGREYNVMNRNYLNPFAEVIIMQQ